MHNCIPRIFFPLRSFCYSFVHGLIYRSSYARREYLPSLLSYPLLSSEPTKHKGSKRAPNLTRPIRIHISRFTSHSPPIQCVSVPRFLSFLLSFLLTFFSKQKIERAHHASLKFLVFPSVRPSVRVCVCVCADWMDGWLR